MNKQEGCILGNRPWTYIGLNFSTNQCPVQPVQSLIKFHRLPAAGLDMCLFYPLAPKHSVHSIQVSTQKRGALCTTQHNSDLRCHLVCCAYMQRVLHYVARHVTPVLCCEWSTENSLLFDTAWTALIRCRKTSVTAHSVNEHSKIIEEDL